MKPARIGVGIGIGIEEFVVDGAMRCARVEPTKAGKRIDIDSGT